MNSGVRPPAVLTEESEHQLHRLRRGLKRMEGFALYVVVARDLGRVELLRRLRAWSGVGGVPELFFFPEGEAGARAVDGFLAARDEKHALTGAVIPHGDALLDVDEGNALSTLNVARDVLCKVIRGPLLLVLSPEREGDLSQRAPDLFDVRAGTVAVEAMAVEPGPVDVSTVARSRRGPARTAAELQVEAARLRALAETEDPPFGALSDAWVRLGWQFVEQGEAGEAREAAKTAQRLAERAGYTSGVAEGMALEGQVLEDAGKIEEAQAWYERSLAIHEKRSDRSGVASSYHQLGRVAKKRGELDKAQACYERSLAIHEELSDRRGMASSYHQLGMVSQDRGELDKAQTWYQRSLAIHEELSSRTGMASSYHQLGIVAQMRGELDEAQAWYEKALASYEEHGNHPNVALSYGQLGLLAVLRGDHPQALDWTVRAFAARSDFFHPMTVPAPHNIVVLVRDQGMPALEASWQRVTGEFLPAHVRSYVDDQIRESSSDKASR